MKLLCRLFGAIVVLMATIGIFACVAGIVGIWVFHQDASRKLEDVSGRLEVALGRFDANQKVQIALKNARADVDRVNKESAALGNGPEKDRLTGAVIRGLIRERVGPNVNDLSGRLAAYSDAAIAVSSLLQSLQELQLSETGHFDPATVEHASALSAQLAATLQRLNAVVGEGDVPTSAREVADAATRVDDILQQCQETVNGWQSDLDAARDGLPRLKARILYWLTLLAITVTVVGVWVGLGQLSLFAHGWKWCRGG